MLNNTFTIRLAHEHDLDTIYYFIHQLAKYERMTQHVVLSKEDLQTALFQDRHAEVLLAFNENTPIGFAVFYPVFSTFQGKASLYLEDLFIENDFRQKGYGKALLSALAKIALKRGYTSMKWSCLDWNQASIDFYKNLGAKQIIEWLYFSLNQASLKSLIKESNQ